MNFALFYLVRRALYRTIDFFHHWYVDATRSFFHRFVSLLEELDRTFAVRVTFRYLFQPLYKDYTIIGRILGMIFRSGRIFVGVFVYLLFGILFIGAYLVWLLVPPLIIFYAARNF